MADNSVDGQTEEDEAFETSPLVDLVHIAWRRKSLVALGIVLAIVAGALYYAQATPIYQSSAEVLVVKKRPEVVTGNDMYASQFEDYVSTHTVLIKSPLIIEQAVESAGLSSLKTFAELEGDLTETIIENLSVGRGSKDLGKSADSILTLSFRGTVPGECATVVQAILDSYREFLDETYRSMGEDTIALITQAREVLKRDLQEQEAAYREFRHNSPLVSQGTEEINPRRARLVAIETQLSELLLRKTDFEAQLRNIQNAENAGRNRAEMVATVSNLSQKTEQNYGRRDSSPGLDNELLSLLHEEQKLLQVYGSDHPKVRSVRQQIQGTREFFAFPDAVISSATERFGTAEHDSVAFDPVRFYKQYLEQELDRIRVSQQLLTDLYEQEHEAAKQLTTFELQDEAFKRDILRTQELYDGIVSQLQGASLVKDYGGFEARVIAPARIGEKVEPRTVFVFGAALLLGCVFGCGTAYVAEATDKKFRTPDDIKQELGYPILGHLPEIAPLDVASIAAQDSITDPMLYAYHKPRSMQTEAYRGVRTALYFSTRGHAHKVIQVTSATPGDGKSTLVSNLAICIAQSGKRVLLIDADMRRPKQHLIFGLPPEKGLATVIGLDGELTDSIHANVIPNLSILPSGDLPPDPSELLSSRRFAELICAVREKYDYVLLDTGPLLAITDPSAVASRVDSVLVTMRLSKSSRAEARRVKEILSELNANVMGVVVNGVAKTTSSSYGYGYYGYSSDYATDHTENGQKPQFSSKRLAGTVRRA